MLEITTAENVYHVISEPGDMTRYDYFIYLDGDDFCFMPCRSTFKYPQRLNYWEIKGLDDIGKVFEFLESADIDCNPHTLFECIKTGCRIRETLSNENKKT